MCLVISVGKLCLKGHSRAEKAGHARNLLTFQGKDQFAAYKLLGLSNSKLIKLFMPLADESHMRWQ